MAYKRPLTKRQSYLLIGLWLVFLVIYLLNIKFSLSSLLIIAFSGFFVLYPIIHSKVFSSKE